MTARGSSTSLSFAWIDLIRPIRAGNDFDTVGGVSLEDQVAIFQWLLRSSRRWARNNPRQSDGWPDDPWPDHVVYDRSLFDMGFGPKLLHELQDRFSRLLLTKWPKDSATFRWMKAEGISIHGRKRLQFRRFKHPDPFTIVPPLRDLHALIGRNTAYSWNPCHPAARKILDVRLILRSTSFALRVSYGVDGSRWEVLLEANRGELLRPFLRRWSAEQVQGASPAEVGKGGSLYLVHMLSRTGHQTPRETLRMFLPESYEHDDAADEYDPNDPGPAWVGLYVALAGSTLRCARCGATQAQPFPVPTDDLLAAATAFEHQHAKCVP